MNFLQLTAADEFTPFQFLRHPAEPAVLELYIFKFHIFQHRIPEYAVSEFHVGYLGMGQRQMKEITFCEFTS